MAQSLLFRQAQVIAGGWEPVLSIILSAWLAGAAAGAVCGPLIPGRVRLAAGIACAAAAGPAGLLAIRLLPLAAGIPAGESAPFSLTILAGLVAALPGAASGLLFAANCRREPADAWFRAVWIYAAEGVGMAAGGALVLAGTLARLPDTAAAFLSSAALAAVALATTRHLRWSGIAAAAGLVGAIVASPALDDLLLPILWRLPHGSRILSSQITPHGWTLVAEREGQRELRRDGSPIMVDPPGPQPGWTVHPVAAAADPGLPVLLAGGEQLLEDLLLHPFPAIDLAPIDREPVFAWRAASPAFATALSNPRVRILEHDARNRLLFGQQRYGMILVPLHAALSLAGNRLQTEEFFRAAAGRLLPGGFVVLAIPFRGESPAPAEAFRTATILSALGNVFAHVDLLAGAGEILAFAGDRPPPDVASLRTELSRRGIATPSFRPEGLTLLGNPVRAQAILGPVADFSPAPPNRDATLLAGRAAFAEAVGRLAPDAAPPLLRFVRHPVLPAAAGLAICLAGILPLGLPRRNRSAVAIGAIGAFSLTTETVLLYLFQARHGLLYSLVGLLLGAFMLGLSAGAAAGSRLAPFRHLPPVVPPAGLLAVAVTILLLAPRGLGTSLAMTAGLVITVGFLDGLAYPLLVRTEGEGSPLRLYAAEVAGASVGNLALSLVVLPVAGPLATVAVCAVLVAVASFPLALPPAGRS